MSWKQRSSFWNIKRQLNTSTVIISFILQAIDAKSALWAYPYEVLLLTMISPGYFPNDSKPNRSVPEIVP